ncbi:hypothetical protein ARGLB_110_00200 [Arthrobacter globiformis NBRC 12137]|uniref:Uncharacterized protein n=1 Tax=Arthrobacter globiformis (strain ATCC 8010 / DSM 20124 / JCM 1332 / NBRC 12137 / NCIMB 8907 / NRRL B-2979 / 168) TaxID=1077972 RepID=H0QTA8_ARTG1|nr:hypothetical protein ARGLB_110_00200 [Arthrobacter globiformis NBRC 12137]
MALTGIPPIEQPHRIGKSTTLLEPFVRLRPVDGETPDDLQWLPKRECLDPDDRPEEDLALEQLFALGSAVTRITGCKEPLYGSPPPDVASR